MTLNNQSLAHELNIILAFTSPEFLSHESAVLEQLVNKKTNWQLVIEYAQHHRLIPQLYNNLRKTCPDLVPKSIFNHLKSLYGISAKQSLTQAAELKRFIPALNRNGIDIAILKGRALVKPLYGNISQRQSRDIDCLVRESDVIKTDSILRKLGYEHANTKSGLPLDSALGRRFIRGRSELDYFSKSRGTCVDLHWHLSLSHHAFPVEMNDLWSQMMLVENEYGQVNELPLSMHFIFLCYHGAKHQWLRLHWLLDIALLTKQGKLDWRYIIESAKQLGVLPTVSLSVVLANKFFGVLIPELIKQNSESLRCGHELADVMIKDITRTPAEIESHVMPFMDFKRIKFGHRLQTNFPHKFLTWTDLLFPSDTDYQSVKFPAFLYFLYFFVRPLRLAIKLAQRILDSLTLRKPIPVRQ